MDFIKNIYRNTLLHKHCDICGRSKDNTNKPLCSYCYESLPHTGHDMSQYCFRCGIAIPAYELSHYPTKQQSSDIIRSCGACLAKDPIQYRSVSAFDYLFPIPELIAQIKFQRRLEHLDLLTTLFS